MSDEKNIRIILVDDHIKVHHAISLLIDYLDNIELVAQGSNGEEAIQLCAEYNPDIVLMDIKMPKVDGLEATRQIKTMHIDIPIIALTAYAMKDDREKAVQAEMVDYISKPVDQKDLFDKLVKYAGCEKK